MLARGRYWQASLTRSEEGVALELPQNALPADAEEAGELRIEVPLERWHLLVKNVHGDRKLLGGVLLDYAKNKDRVAVTVGNDRLFAELQRVILDATVALAEAGLVVISRASSTDT
jgi:hypothetical protein